MVDYSKGFGHTDASRPAKLPSDIMLERVIERGVSRRKTVN